MSALISRKIILDIARLHQLLFGRFPFLIAPLRSSAVEGEPPGSPQPLTHLFPCKLAKGQAKGSLRPNVTLLNLSLALKGYLCSGLSSLLTSSMCVE